ncbi:hypothetical protein EPM78_11350 [Neisseria gonorrhoeae]|nr:hypothetical protein EGH15_12555 [Neisseria gonorrhoeae]AZG26245.1 hypothetical protein EGH18_12560 [Neisseria gonorrhoeae]AZG43104.1 hypothetical protein EGH11_12545 [Neisseria gonorrhoeae]QIH15956.1 hypothetical protein F0T11_12345 [Neisseria gonorrhoeae]QIH18221.1 hypothetical protein F0T12_12360 [Neisseria gonorrhoeae]
MAVFKFPAGKPNRPCKCILFNNPGFHANRSKRLINGINREFKRGHLFLRRHLSERKPIYRHSRAGGNLGLSVRKLIG